MLTSEAVTGASGIPVGYATLALVYVGVALGVLWFLRRLAQMPLDPHDSPPSSSSPHPARSASTTIRTRFTIRASGEDDGPRLRVQSRHGNHRFD